jgi:hypothetical protein
MTERTSAYKDPSWWQDSHSSAWERTKEALRRDWEQTKADLTKGGRELNQDVGDTLKQSAGKAPIPPANLPNPPDADERADWNDLEPAVRYGYGARQHYGQQAWNAELEGKLRKDWDETGNSGPWERVKGAVRRGWESISS